MNLREIARPTLTKPTSDRLLQFFDFAGTLVFAVEGAMAAENGNLDLLGAMVLAFATALGGGIIRDLFIGDIPPASLRDWRYAVFVFLGGAFALCLYRFMPDVPPLL